MATNNIFISFSTRDSKQVTKYVEKLRENNFSCFMASPGKNAKSEYINAINDAILEAPVFVVFITPNSFFGSKWVENEIEYRINSKHGYSNLIPVILEGRPEYYSGKQIFQKIITNCDYLVFESNFKTLINSLIEKIKTYLRDNESNTRDSSQYKYNEIEAERLRIQSGFLTEFAGKHFYDFVQNKKDIAILDIGCGKNNYFTSFIEMGNVKYVLGLDINEEMIKEFNDNYKTDFVEALLCDVTTEKIHKCISSYLTKHHLSGFDAINISMVLLFIKSREKIIKLLSTIREYMNDGAKIFITTIDDELIVTYPDEDGLYERVKKYSLLDSIYGGHRTTGRSVPYYLTKAGFHNITLLANGINTLNKDKETLEVLFKMCIMNFLNDYKTLKESGEDKALAEEALSFFTKNYNDLRERFLSDGFFCNIGYLLFSADK